MITFALLNGFLLSGSGADSWGHLGGFMVGLALGVILLKSAEPSD